MEYFCPLFGLKELCRKMRCKVGIGKIWRIVLFHEFNNVPVRVGPFPPVPKPSSDIAGDRKHAPVQEDSKLRLIVPLRQRSLVKRLPVGLVTHAGHSCAKKPKTQRQKCQRACGKELHNQDGCFQVGVYMCRLCTGVE